MTGIAVKKIEIAEVNFLCGMKLRYVANLACAKGEDFLGCRGRFTGGTGSIGAESTFLRLGERRARSADGHRRQKVKKGKACSSKEIWRVWHKLLTIMSEEGGGGKTAEAFVSLGEAKISRAAAACSPFAII